MLALQRPVRSLLSQGHRAETRLRDRALVERETRNPWKGAPITCTISCDLSPHPGALPSVTSDSTFGRAANRRRGAPVSTIADHFGRGSHASTWVHADRAAGRDRDHRRPDRPAVARRPGGTR